MIVLNNSNLRDSAVLVQQLDELRQIEVPIEPVFIEILGPPVARSDHGDPQLEQLAEQRSQHHAVLDGDDGELVEAEHLISIFIIEIFLSCA